MVQTSGRRQLYPGPRARVRALAFSIHLYGYAHRNHGVHKKMEASDGYQAIHLQVHSRRG